MEFLSKKEIMEHLKNEGANESELCEVCGTDIVYFTIYPNTQSDFDLNFSYLAKTFVKCKEGFIEIPVIEYDPHNGFEQFDLQNIKDITKEEVKNYYEAILRRADTLKQMICD
ncbi:hypothetical protein ACSW8S_16770 (plasmid) [Clostridium perfringens]